MKDIRLKDCPFCKDSKPWVRFDDNSDYREYWCHYVKCDCTAQGPAERTEDEAIQAWNNRG